MFKKDKATRDIFSLSLGGMTVASSFAPMPAIAHDRLQQVRENRQQPSTAGRDCSPFPRLASYCQTAHDACA